MAGRRYWLLWSVHQTGLARVLAGCPGRLVLRLRIPLPAGSRSRPDRFRREGPPWNRTGPVVPSAHMLCGTSFRFNGADPSCGDDGTMASTGDRGDARVLAGQAASHVGRAPGREPVRAALKWLTRGRLGSRHGWPVVPVLGTPWQDTVSAERNGWRQRAAYLGGHQVFAVDYQVCGRCGLGWVEQPYTDPRYQRCGLAAAGLAALRAEHPGLEWHTLGGHLGGSGPSWLAVGKGVAGGYTRRPVCPHRGDG